MGYRRMVLVKPSCVWPRQLGVKHERISDSLRANGLPHDIHFAAYCNNSLGIVLQCFKKVCTVFQGTTGSGRYREKRLVITSHTDVHWARYFRPVTIPFSACPGEYLAAVA